MRQLFQLACQANVQSAPELLNYSQGPFDNPVPPLETAQEVREMQQGKDVLMVMMMMTMMLNCSREPDKGNRDKTMGLAVVIHRYHRKGRLLQAIGNATFRFNVFHLRTIC